MSFGYFKFQGLRRKTRREALLERMDAIVVWDSWIVLVDTSYHGQALVRHVRAAKTKL